MDDNLIDLSIAGERYDPSPAGELDAELTSIDLHGRVGTSVTPGYPAAGHDLSTVQPLAGPDLMSSGEPVQNAPKPGVGPRQRRFDFDSRVIRDSMVRKFRSVNRDDLADTIDACHRTPMHRQCKQCSTVRTFFNRCENFYCPICSARLARDRRETVAWWSKVVAQPKHVVLTVTSVPVLSKDYVRKLKNDLRKLRSQVWSSEGEMRWTATAVRPSPPNREPVKDGHRRNNRLSVWHGEKRYTKSTAWRGGFWSIDCTWNRPSTRGELMTINGKTFTSQRDTLGGWHLHFHLIVDANFIDRNRLEEAWCKLRGQEMAVVRVYDVRGRDYTAEACKYVCDGVQLGNWPADKLVEFADALANERCFDTFGSLYKQRAEWSAARKEIHADRAVCECGCNRFEFFNEDEWEWVQSKSSLAPPTAQPHRVVFHPELTLTKPGIVK